MAGDTIAQYLDDDGNPVGAGSDVKPPKGYSLLTSKKSPVAPKKKVADIKAQAEKLKPVSPPPGYIVSAYTPSVFEQARSAVANSAIGYSLEQALPSIATALHLHPTEKMGTPQAAAHKDQLIAPEYLAPAVTEAIRTGPLMGAPAPPEGRAPDSTSNRIEGALTAAGGLTSGKSMATMGGIAAAAGLTAGVVNPASAQLLSRLVSGGFTADMLHGLYQQHKEYRKAVDAGDVNEAQKIQGEMGVTGIMALLTGKHALSAHPFTPIEPKDIPVRERTNVLHRNTAGEVRQAKGQAPSVWLSPDAWKSFMGSLYPGEDATETHGINLKADRNLEGFANDPELSAADPHFGEVQKLLAEAHKNAGKGGVSIANTRPSLQANVNVMREELNHSWQRSLSANSHFNNHLSAEAFQDLHQNIPKGMKDYLVEQGYEGQEAPLLVTEAAAKLMDGRPERFGTTPDEAVDFLDKYFKHVTEQHGAKALEELHHVRGIAADAKARAIGEHSGTGGGQDNSAVSGVAAGGQGSAEAGVPTQGEVNDPTGTPSPLLVSPVSGESSQTPASAGNVGAGEASSIPQENQPLAETGAEGRGGSEATGDVAQPTVGLDNTPYREQINTPEFRSWFGKSKVVDANGSPIQLYHGTNRAGFDSFKKDILNPNSLYGSGVYTTDSPSVASGYATESSVRGSYDRQDMRKYFTPGRIVDGYGGKDKVLDFKEDDPYKGAWSVKVQRVDAQGNPMRGEAPRWHSTMPDVEKVNKALGGSQAVYPLFASLQKPFDVDGRFTREEAENIFGKYNKTGWVDRAFKDEAEVDRTIGGTTPEVTPTVSGQLLYEYGQQAFDDYNDQSYSRDTEFEPPKETDLPSHDAQSAQDQVNHALKEAGYDGIKHTGGKITKGNKHNVWISFDPTKIKSAIGNRGTFDPNESNILFNRESDAPQPATGQDENDPSPTPEMRKSVAEEGVPLFNREQEKYGGYARHTEQVPVAALDKYKEADRSLSPKGDMEALKEDIKANGIKEPLILNYDPDSGKAGLGEGNTRLQAAKELGLKTVPVRVRRSSGRGGVAEVGAYSGPETDYHGNPRVPGDLSPSHIGIETIQDEDDPSAEQKNSESNTSEIGDGGQEPEHPEGEDVAPPAEPSVIQIQGGTQLAFAPVQEPVVPIVTKPDAKVLPLSQIKIIAAGLMPNPKQPTVKSVRELMQEAAKRNPTAMIP